MFITPNRINKGSSGIVVLIAMFILIMTLAVVFGYFITWNDTNTVLLIIVGVVVFIFSFVSRLWALYFIIFATIFSPEVAMTGASASRAVTVRAEDLLLLVVMAGWFVNLATDKTKGMFRGASVNNSMMIYSFILILATLLGMISGYVKIMSGFFYTLKMLEYFVLFFLVLNTPLDKKQIIRLIYMHLFTSFILGVYGMDQIGTGERVSTPFEGENAEPSTMGGYLVLSMSITFSYVLHHGGLMNRLFFLVFTSLLLIPMLHTMSRASFIAFFFAYISFIFISRNKALVLLILFAGIVLIPIVLPDSVMDRIYYTFEGDVKTGFQVGNIVLEESTALRLRSFLWVMDKLAVSPLFGFGVTGVGFIDGMYFRVLGETGVLGLLTFLWLQFSVMLMTYRVIRKTNDSFTRAFAIGFLAGHVGLMFHGLGTSTHLIIRIQEPFWFLAALVVHLDLLETQQNTEDEITDAESPLTPQVFPRELARI